MLRFWLILVKRVTFSLVPKGLWLINIFFWYFSLVLFVCVAPEISKMKGLPKCIVWGILNMELVKGPTFKEYVQLTWFFIYIFLFISHLSFCILLWPYIFFHFTYFIKKIIFMRVIWIKTMIIWGWILVTWSCISYQYCHLLVWIQLLFFHISFCLLWPEILESYCLQMVLASS